MLDQARSAVRAADAAFAGSQRTAPPLHVTFFGLTAPAEQWAGDREGARLIGPG